MRPLSNAQLLEAWEAGLGQRNVERALSLLVAGVPEASAEALASLSIGQRDLHLFRLREATFGGDLPIITDCPGCGESLEAELRVADLLLADERDAEREHELERDGRTIRFRLPNSIDVAAVRGRDDAVRALFARCVVDGGDGAQDEVVDAVAARMAELDPQSDVELSLSCPNCGHAWRTPLDIASYFWSEVEAWAQRLLLEVHQLARGYGWSERDILAMSARRRRAYLELLA